MCFQQVPEIDVPPKLQIFLHECPKPRPNIAIIRAAIIILGNEPFNVLLESIAVAIRVLQFLAELCEMVGERRFDAEVELQLVRIL